MELIGLSPRVQELKKSLSAFVENDCIPAEQVFHQQVSTGQDRWKSYPIIIEELKTKAKSMGLWNLFLHKEYDVGCGLSNLEYAVLCEIIGKSLLAPEATNTAAPDTGNHYIDFIFIRNGRNTILDD